MSAIHSFHFSPTNSRVPFLAVFTLLVLLLSACHPAASSSEDTAPVVVYERPAVPVDQPVQADHVPVILKVVERSEGTGNTSTVYTDITFSDAVGDATAIMDTLVSSGQGSSASDVDLHVPAEEQLAGVMVTDTWSCGSNPRMQVETRIRDLAGNLSEPVLITISCPVYLPNLLPFLIGGLVIVCGMLIGGWLLFRNRPLERRSTYLSIILFFCLIFPMNLVFYILHEGGHALTTLAHGVKVSLFFVHPFSFGGYNLPPYDWGSAFYHAGGVLAALPIALLISLPFWKHRSLSTLPLVMVFPWVAILQGQRMLLVGGDFASIVHLTGIPILLFIIAGFLAVMIGICLLVSLFPLFGVEPGSRKSFLVFPVALIIWSLLGMAVAFLFLPGTSVDTQYGLTREIFNSSIIFLCASPVIGLLLAAVYQKFYSRFPAPLQTRVVTLAWKDLRLPGLLAFTSILLGLLVITCP